MKKKGRRVEDVTVLLTVFKRDNLIAQLEAVAAQSVVPKEIVVFQNDNFQQLPPDIVEQYGAGIVRNSKNTRFFGRFAYLLNASTRFVAVIDDDVLPGCRFLESYLAQVRRLGAIVGGNGRIAMLNPARRKLNQPPDFGLRPAPVLTDFVGHAWVFEQQLLYDMFSVKPTTQATGEDMHLCFAAKLRSGIPSFVAAQATEVESSDSTLNAWASDRHSSFKITSRRERRSVEKYFFELGVSFITEDEQRATAVAVQTTLVP